MSRNFSNIAWDIIIDDFIYYLVFLDELLGIIGDCVDRKFKEEKRYEIMGKTID